MNRLKIAFVDGGEAFENITKNVLSNDFEVISTVDNPDLCIFNFNDRTFHKRLNCKRIEISGENRYPHFEDADYSITCHHIEFGNRHCRIPFYAFNKEYGLLVNDDFEYDDGLYNRPFCSAVVSNSIYSNPFRVQFMHSLDITRKICSIGGAYRNAPFTIAPRPNNAENGEGTYTNPPKIDFIGRMKFNISMENSSIEGYVTEKITDAFAARTIPIYWGASDIGKEFNLKSFIRLDETKSMEENISKVIEVSDDKDKYMEMLREKKILNTGYMNKYHDFLMNAIEGRRYVQRYGNLALQ